MSAQQSTPILGATFGPSSGKTVPAPAWTPFRYSTGLATLWPPAAGAADDRRNNSDTDVVGCVRQAE